MVQVCGHMFRLIFIGLLSMQLSACLEWANWEKWKDANKNDAALNSFITSIAVDNDNRLYIATVSGKIMRYDGHYLTEIIPGHPLGFGLARSIRFAQNNLYIHYKRYIDKDAGYTDEMLLFSADGEYIEQLFSKREVADLVKNNTKGDEHVLLADIAANNLGQLYTLTKPTALLRINYDKQNLVRIEPDISANLIIENEEYLAEISGIDLSKVADLEEIQDLPELPAIPLDGLTSIAIDSQNNIYIGSLFGVFKFDAKGQYLKTIVLLGEHTLDFPTSLAIDPAGNIIIANFHKTIPASMDFIKLDANGNNMGVFIPAGTAGLGLRVDDMLFDHAGNFYIVDTIQGIFKFDSAGQFIDIIIKPFS